MKYYKKVEGKNLYLSPINLEDAEKFCEWMSDNDVTDGINATRDVFTLKDEINYLEEFSKNNDIIFGIVRKENDELIGSCSFTHVDYMTQCAELGIIIGDPDSRGKGYGQEVVKMLLEYGFNTLNFHSIYLTVYTFNEDAIACYKKVGFKEIGKRREAGYINGKRCDILYMDILKEEYDK